MKTPILGASYVARSVNAADNVCINLFPEVIPEGGKESAFLQTCPGLSVVAGVGTGPIRGLWTFNGIGYVASGSELYSLSPTFVATKLGNITGSGPVSMADNGTQLFVACNPDAFVYNTTTGVFAQVTDPDFPGAVTVGYINGYFAFNQPNSQKWWITAFLDGTSVDPLDFASAEGSPDNLVSLLILHNEVWLFGQSSIEVWAGTDSAGFPFERIQGALIEIGCAAPYSPAILDNAVFWLGADRRGRGIIYRSNGYNGTRVSTHAVEWQIQSYGDISDAVAYTYQQDGHSFYVISFPRAQKTWCYDVATQRWHERAGFSNGTFLRHRSNCQMQFANQTIVGDYENGNLYAFNLDTYENTAALLLEASGFLLLENGNTIGLESTTGNVNKWVRSWRALPTGQNNLNRTAHHSLQLDIQSGVGTATGQGQDPQVLLRWSDDGGHTWSNYHSRSMGAMGETGHRVIWRRLGMTEKLRDRVYEVSGSDPVKVIIVGAELHASGTNA